MQTHLRYLAEVLAAEVDDRTERRRTRRINDANFPRLKRLAAFLDPRLVAAIVDRVTLNAHLLETGTQSY